MLSQKFHPVSLALVLTAVLMLLAFPAAAEDFNYVQSEVAEEIQGHIQQMTVTPASACRGNVWQTWRLLRTPNILCRGLIPNRIYGNMQSVTIANRTANRRGTAIYQCRNGRWTGVSGSCVAVGSTCPSGAWVPWGPATGGCGGRTWRAARHGEQIRVVSSTVRRGGANVRCLNGRWVVQPGWTCTGAGCPGGERAWGQGNVSGCRGNVPAGPPGQIRTVHHNTRFGANRQGSARFQCSANGNWVMQRGQTCRDTGQQFRECPEQKSITWGNCRNVPHYISRTPNYLVRSRHGTTKRIIHRLNWAMRVTGTRNYRCDNGTWRVVNETCLM